MTLAIQTAIGGAGSKATTELSFSYDSLLNHGGNQYGANSDGLYLLNTGSTDGSSSITHTFTLATNDLGYNGFKRARFLYMEFDSDNDITVKIRSDNQNWYTYVTERYKDGLQRVRIPIDGNSQGSIWTIKVESTSWFRITHISGLFIRRPLGVVGY